MKRYLLNSSLLRLKQLEERVHLRKVLHLQSLVHLPEREELQLPTQSYL
jgi:hypothetical protein